MDIEVNEVMKKIAKLSFPPVRFVGFVSEVCDDTARLYPTVGACCFWEIATKDIVHVIPAPDNTLPAVLLVESKARVNKVCKEVLLACEAQKPSSSCGCDGGSPESLNAEREDALLAIIALARAMVDLGVTELDCTRSAVAGGSVGAGCCRLLNRLLGAISNGGDVRAAAIDVLGGCAGSGT